ncbi:MAG: hypothetical protein DMG06_11135 [Acidobacteria bacterium]|nr:MAG: hypothetical protein DMG06_11135 [Acidobacteriota bacterium]
MVPPTPQVTSWLLPSSARAPGLRGSFFSTDLTVSNTGSAAAAFTLKFLGNNRDGRTGTEKSFTLDRGQSVTYPDVLDSVFGLSEGFGAIRITSATPTLTVMSQTSTSVASGGTYGQGVPAAAASDLIVSGLPQSIGGVREDTAFRTNLILANPGEDPLDVEVKPLRRFANRRTVIPGSYKSRTSPFLQVSRPAFPDCFVRW